MARLRRETPPPQPAREIQRRGAGGAGGGRAPADPAGGGAPAGGAPAAGDPVAGLDVGALPPVREVLATSRQRLEALNGPGMARI